jgi:hypothetical protein
LLSLDAKWILSIVMGGQLKVQITSIDSVINFVTKDVAPE